MQNQNPYEAPAAVVADLVGAGPQLADRGLRLVGAIADTFILVLILLPLMFVGGYFSGIMSGRQPGIGEQLLWGFIGIVVFVVVQGFPLYASGQTWGKKLLRMKIVDLDGNKPEFLKLIALRYLAVQAIALVPVLGNLFAFVDALFIFADDRRCLHDRIAGTRVVMVD